MKGYIFVFVFFVCLATAAQAQLKFDREIQTGLFVPKGAWLVGTTLSYTELRSTDFKLLVLKDLKVIHLKSVRLADTFLQITWQRDYVWRMPVHTSIWITWIWIWETI